MDTIESFVATIEHTPLSTDQLTELSKKVNYRGYVPKVKVELYDNLAKITNINDLFENKYDSVILLYQLHNGDTPIGHFIAIIKHDHETYSYYDSYALGVEELLHRIHEEGFIKRLIMGHTIDINTHQHQQFLNSSNTCGLHALVRCLFPKLNNEGFHLFFKPYMDKHVDLDIIVSLIFAFTIEN